MRQTIATNCRFGSILRAIIFGLKSYVLFVFLYSTLLFLWDGSAACICNKQRTNLAENFVYVFVRSLCILLLVVCFAFYSITVSHCSTSTGAHYVRATEFGSEFHCGAG